MYVFSIILAVFLVGASQSVAPGGPQVHPPHRASVSRPWSLLNWLLTLGIRWTAMVHHRASCPFWSDAILTTTNSLADVLPRPEALRSSRSCHRRFYGAPVSRLPAPLHLKSPDDDSGTYWLGMASTPRILWVESSEHWRVSLVLDPPDWNSAVAAHHSDPRRSQRCDRATSPF